MLPIYGEIFKNRLYPVDINDRTIHFLPIQAPYRSWPVILTGVVNEIQTSVGR